MDIQPTTHAGVYGQVCNDAMPLSEPKAQLCKGAQEVYDVVELTMSLVCDIVNVANVYPSTPGFASTLAM